MSQAIVFPSLTPVSLIVDQPAIAAYAALTQDFNPLHLDPTFAASTSMGGIIAHGTLSFNLILQSVRSTFGDEALLGAEINIRFVHPVRCGDLVVVGGEVSGETGDYEVWVKTEAGEHVIEGTLVLPAWRK